MPRKKKGNLREEIYHQLDNNIDFSIVAYFFQVHKQLFNLQRIDTKQSLAEELIRDELSPEFEEDLVCFLKFLTGSTDISASNWETIAEEQLDLIGVTDSPLLDVDFVELSREKKAKVLKQLIDAALQFKREELEIFKKESAESQCVFEPIGCDKDGNKYWYFGDTKLIREYAKERKGWDVSCTSQDQWHLFMDSLKRTNDNMVRKLHQKLKQDVWPSVESKFKQSNSPHSDSKSKNVKKTKRKSQSVSESEMHLLNGNGSITHGSSGSESEVSSAKPVRKKPVRKKMKRKSPREILTEDDDQVKVTKESEEKEQKPLRSSPVSPERDDHAEQQPRSDSPGIDLGVFEPRGKRRCVLALEKKKDTVKEWWDGEEAGEDEEENMEDDADYISDDADSPNRQSHSHRKRKEEKLTVHAPPNRMYAFSTVLANRAAMAVARGAFDSIISFHRAQHFDGPYLTAEKHCRQPSNNPVDVILPVPAQTTSDATPTQPLLDLQRNADPIAASKHQSRPTIDSRKSIEPEGFSTSSRGSYANGTSLMPSTSVSSQAAPLPFSPIAGVSGHRERDISIEEWQRIQLLQSLRHGGNQTMPPSRPDMPPFIFNNGYSQPTGSPAYFATRPTLYGSPYELDRMGGPVPGRFQPGSPYDAIYAQQQQQRFNQKDPLGFQQMAAHNQSEMLNRSNRNVLPGEPVRDNRQSIELSRAAKIEPDRGLTRGKTRTPDIPFPFDISQQIKPPTASPPSHSGSARSSTDSPNPVYMDLSNSRAPSSAVHIGRHAVALPPSMDRKYDATSKGDNGCSVIKTPPMLHKPMISSPNNGQPPSKMRYSPSGNKSVDLASLVARRPHPFASQAPHPYASQTSRETYDSKVPSRTSFSIESLAAPTYRNDMSQFAHGRVPFSSGNFAYAGPGPGFSPYHRYPPGFMPNPPSHFEHFLDGRPPNNGAFTAPPKNVNGR